MKKMDEPTTTDLLDSLVGKRLKSWEASFLNGSPASPHSLTLNFEGGGKVLVVHTLNQDEDGTSCDLMLKVEKE